MCYFRALCLFPCACAVAFCAHSSESAPDELLSRAGEQGWEAAGPSSRPRAEQTPAALRAAQALWRALLSDEFYIGPRERRAEPAAAPKISAPAPAPERPAGKPPAKAAPPRPRADGAEYGRMALVGVDPANGGSTLNERKGYYVLGAGDPARGSGLAGANGTTPVQNPLLQGPQDSERFSRWQVPVLSLPIGLPTISIVHVPGFTVTSDAQIDWRVIGVPMPGFGPGNLVLPSTKTPARPDGK